MTIDTSVDAVAKLLDGVTDGPWEVKTKGGETHLLMDGKSVMCDMTYYPWVPENYKDWVFIAAARQLVPALSETPMQCAECDCGNPPHGCNWIKAGDGT